VALNAWPLAASVTVMVAPGTTAPLGSRITPRSEVVAIWATADAARMSIAAAAAMAELRLVTTSSKNTAARP
jgi:hypothetical protein